MRSMPLFPIVLLAGCGIELKVEKPQHVDLQIPAASTATAACSATPFGSATIDITALAKNAQVDLNQGCLKSAVFNLVQEVTTMSGGTSPSGTCTSPRGIVTLEKFRTELTCQDKSTKIIENACPQKTVDLSDDVGPKLAACLDTFEVDKTEELRRAVNACKPTSMVAAFHGSCSADTCFTAEFKVSLRLESAVAVVNGSCP